jgi:hypothetical protein
MSRKPRHYRRFEPLFGIAEGIRSHQFGPQARAYANGTADQFARKTMPNGHISGLFPAGGHIRRANGIWPPCKVDTAGDHPIKLSLFWDIFFQVARHGHFRPK